MTDIASSNSRGFSRRSFIAGAAALTAAGVLSGCSSNTGGLAYGGFVEGWHRRDIFWLMPLAVHPGLLFERARA